MVFGTPTTGTPSAYSRVATPRVSSPPVTTRASPPRPDRLSLIRSPPERPPLAALSARGLVRDEPRIVPPRGRIPRTACTSRGMVSPSRGPRHPSRNPTNSYPNSWDPRRTSARITAFNPGQSPPPVSTPTRIAATLAPGAGGWASYARPPPFGGRDAGQRRRQARARQEVITNEP